MSINDLITMDMQNRDRFELLNAYLDGEVTATERQQIDEWLTTDPKVQCLYTRALKLRQKWQIMSPLTQQPIANKVEQRFLSRKIKPKSAVFRETVLLAVMVLVALSGVLPEPQSYVLPMAQDSQLTVDPQSQIML